MATHRPRHSSRNRSRALVEWLEDRKLFAATEVIVDNLTASLTGSWTKSSYDAGYYGSNYLHDGAAQKGSKAATFTPALTEAGEYEVFARYTDGNNKSPNTPFDITSAAGTTTVNVNQRTNGGQWVSLGTYDFNATGGSVRIRNTDTVGYVVADAIKFTPVSTGPVEPNPMQDSDIGSPALAGSSSMTNGVYTVAGGGADIFDKSDQFHFAYQQLTGDGSITARVVSMENTNEYAKAGVMFRESLTANSRNASMLVKYSQGIGFQRRTVAGGSTLTTNGTGIAAPYWVRVVRTGSTFTAYTSPDGSTWTSQGTTSIALGSTLYVGLAVTSHDNTKLMTAMFDNVTIAPAAAPTGPAAPTNVVATAQSQTSVKLTWTDNATTETGYQIERQTGSGAFALITTTAANATTFTDTTAAAGTTYSYRIRGITASANGDYSALVSVTTPPPVASSDLADADIGTPGVAGSSSLAGGVYTVKGGGADIFNKSDQFHFSYKQLTGDGSITARVVSIGNTDPYAKAGVMFRESLAADSRNVAMLLKYANGLGYQARTSTGGSSTTSNTTGVAAPYWLRLVRVGNVFTAYTSSDGNTWTSRGSSTIAMGATLYVGLAVTSHNNATLNTSTFDNVVVSNSGQTISSLTSGVVGTPFSAGSTNTVIDGRSYTITTAGGQIAGTTDSLRYVYRSFTGGFDIIARVDSLTNSSNTALAGLMTRSGLSGTSLEVFMGVSKTNYVMNWRKTANSAVVTVTGPAVSSGQMWVRLKRSSDYFSGFYSTDGANWIHIDDIDAPAFNPAMYIGLATTGGGGSVNNSVTAAYSQIAGFELDLTTPATPTNLTATATASNIVTLTWNDNSYNEDQFILERRAGANGLWVKIADVDRNVTSYTDAFRVKPTTAYSYRLRSANLPRGKNASPYSNIASATTPAASLPSPWKSTGIGTTAGSAGFASNTYTLTASGAAGLGGTSDAFRYLNQHLYGDGEIVARVSSFAASGANARAGIMLRDTTNANSPFASLLLGTGGLRAQVRTTAGATVTSTAAVASTAPVWVRIVREGQSLKFYYGADGTSWTLMSSQTVKLRSDVYVGLAVASGSASTQSAAFTNVGVTPGIPPAERDWTPLFNGTDLSGFYSWIRLEGKNNDPENYFKVEDGMIHVMDLADTTGTKEFGYLSTVNSYSNYRLRLEFKWGTKQYYPRIGTLRDAGLLFNAVGADRLWPTSIEAQIEETDTGDAWMLNGANATATVNDPNLAEPTYVEGSTLTHTTSGTDPQRIIKSQTVDSLTDWNTMEVIVSGDTATFVVNGVMVQQLKNITQPDPNDPTKTIPLTAGRILLQAEGSEVYYRNIEIQDLGYTPAPAGSTVLFNGTSTSQFTQLDGSAVKWPVNNGAMTVNIGTGNIKTVSSYGDAHLHLEFKSPFQDYSLGQQARGNSGIFFQGRYEIQILDSWASPLVDGDDVGGVYAQKNADVNASLPPDVWQSYDIYFRAARWSGSTKIENARVSVFLNGILVQDDVEIPTSTKLGNAEGAGNAPLILQDSPNLSPVSFRNIWIDPI